MNRRLTIVRCLLAAAALTAIIVGCQPAGAPGVSAGQGGESAEPLLASAAAMDELWVIVEPENRASTDDSIPKAGSLIAMLPNSSKEVPLPLKHTSVDGHIQGYIATVQVQQQFHNPYESKIEAQYVFPLPQNAAVNDFVMTIGERKIRGMIRKRAEAEAIYEN
ncbi:MAG: VIT domain-containing protein, partial [Planctomycetota bacterium]